jgi:4-amino-4-deoxy-L-arabinose transferase-like glycosyltransferase
MLQQIKKVEVSLAARPWTVFGLFLLLVVLLRWPSFYRSVIDLDESLYLLVSRAWLYGAPPYTVVWDNKPPGIYAIFTMALWIFGESVFAIRAVACLFVALSCFFLYRIGSLIESDGRKIGIIAALLYAVASISNGGLASNTEIFYATPTIIAYYLFLRTTFDHKTVKPGYVGYFCTGWLLGLGFEIKYVVAFDFIALVVILTIVYCRQKWPHIQVLSLLKMLFWVSLGFLLPFLIASAYFLLLGIMDDYVYANFTANRLRILVPQMSSRAMILNRVRDHLFYWVAVPAVGIFIIAARKRLSVREAWIAFAFVFWFIAQFVLLCAVFGGLRYDHYYLQLLPPLCFLTAYLTVQLVCARLRRQGETMGLDSYFILAALLLLLVGSRDVIDGLRASAHLIYQRHIAKSEAWQDDPQRIAAYLRPRLKEGDYIYVADGEPIIYFLTNAKIPTRYPFPPFLVLRPDLLNITGAVPVRELDKILEKQPVYIVKDKASEFYSIESNNIFYNKMDQVLRDQYLLEHTVGSSNVYRIREDSRLP